MQLKIVTSEGLSFELESPFNTEININTIKWFESTGEIKFLVYIPTASFLEGAQDIIFDAIYVNGTLDESAIITRIYSETYEVALSKRYDSCPSQVTVEVITNYGEFCEEFDDNLIG